MLTSLSSKWISWKFPVPAISTDQFEAILTDSPLTAVIDARSEEEFAVSHVLGARRVEFQCGQEDLKDLIGVLNEAGSVKVVW